MLWYKSAYLFITYTPLSDVVLLFFAFSSSLESEDSSLELSDLGTRMYDVPSWSTAGGTLLCIVTHSRGLSTLATWTSSCCRNLSARVKLFPQVAQICSLVWSCTSRICLRSLQSSVNSFGQCWSYKIKFQFRLIYVSCQKTAHLQVNHIKNTYWTTCFSIRM